jgi:hypothetical protein
MTRIDSKYLKKAIDYQTYRKLIDELLLEGKTTGPLQLPSLIEYTRLNVARMRRIDKTIEIIADLKKAIEKIDFKQTWLVITEAWCGDAAQTIPVFYALSALNTNIDLKLVLRDENLDLMDKYLTNGKSRSIPKLIVARSDGLEEMFNWGPMPSVLQQQYYSLREKKVDYSEIQEQVHTWYAKDKTVTTQLEILKLITAKTNV